MVECTLFMTHCLRLNLQLHTISLVRTCRISSFCTVAWQLARLLLTRRIAWSLGDSWASCLICRNWSIPGFLDGLCLLRGFWWVGRSVHNVSETQPIDRLASNFCKLHITWRAKHFADLHYAIIINLYFVFKLFCEILCLTKFNHCIVCNNSVYNLQKWVMWGYNMQAIVSQAVDNPASIASSIETTRIIGSV